LAVALRQAVRGLGDELLVLGLVDRLPEHSLALADLAVETTQRALDHHRSQPQPDLAEAARLLNNLSIRRGNVGRRDDALTAIQEAVTIRRQLAHTAPNTYLPNLASSLRLLAQILTDLGRDEQARQVLAESQHIFGGEDRE
jgi:hypothetical protein